jgi:hypothetical protein
MQRELRAVGLSEQAVNDARNDPLLNGTRAQQMVDKCLGELNPALSNAKSNTSASLATIQSAAESAAEQLRHIISEIQRDISNEVSGIQ